jgi:predicted acylesterase/phospholipase RssA
LDGLQDNRFDPEHPMDGTQYDCLILSGGGFKGAYGAGVAKALHSYNAFMGRNRTICYIGTSAGALNAAVLASQGPDALIRFWRTIREEDVLGSSHAPFAFRISKQLLLRWLGDMPWCISGLVQRWQRRGTSFFIYPNKSLRQLIRQSIHLRELQNKHLIITATDLLLGKPAAFYSSSMMTRFLEEDAKLDLGRQRLSHCKPIRDNAELTEVLLASAAIPFFFPPVQVGDRWFIDGGVGNNTPTREAAYFLRYLNTYHLGTVGEVYCVKLAPRRIAIDAMPAFGPKDLLLRTYDVYDYIHMETIIQSWYQINGNVQDRQVRVAQFNNWVQGLALEATIKHQIQQKASELGVLGGHTARLDLNMIEIQPSATLGGTLDFSRPRIKENIERGYADFLSKLLSLPDRLTQKQHQELANARIFEKE